MKNLSVLDNTRGNQKVKSNFLSDVLQGAVKNYRF
jgi:hypothetical protein